MGELAVIFTFVLAATITVFAFVSSMHKRQIAYKERRDTAERERAGGSAASTQRLVQLEDRVQVLERLATDRGQLLSDEIEKLRTDSRSKEKVQ